MKRGVWCFGATFPPRVRQALPAGDHIRFVCGRDDALTRIKRVTRYTNFEDMLDAEGPANVNPDIRRIYRPEKEALGVLAIEIELLTPPESTANLPAG